MGEIDERRSAGNRNQRGLLGQDLQDLQDKARTRPFWFRSFGILFIPLLLSIPLFARLLPVGFIRLGVGWRIN
jgi:hypothetical protein